MRYITAFASWFGPISVSLCLVAPAAAQVEQQRADAFFEEARAICERDGGRLWGVSLCGPMVFADARTRTLATNHPHPAGEWPRVLGFTNAPLEWGNSRWAAYIWDFTTSLWLRLEWRALLRALDRSGEDRTRAVGDAVAFRSVRRSQFATAAESERVEEIREGLAQYTGIVAAADTRADAVASTIQHLTGAEGHETFLQQSYATGTAYAVLLDDASADWRRRVRSDSDLGEMLMAALEIAPAADAVEASARYGGTDIRTAELALGEQRRARILELRSRFVDGPGLLVPSGGGATFNAVGATPLPGTGTVFVMPYRTSSAWGTLEATKGILIQDDGARRLPGPVRIEGTTLTGDGWTVTLAPGWSVGAGPRSGDYQIVRDPQ